MMLRTIRRPTRLLIAVVFLATLDIPLHPTAAVAGTVEDSISISLVRGVPTSLALPWKANLVAVSQALGSPDPGVQVRFQDRWDSLGFEPDHGASGLEATRSVQRSFSDPLWIGTARTLTMRATAGSATLRLHLINTLGDSSVAPRPLRILGSMWRGLLAPRRPAQAMTVERPVIPRSGWGADESWRTPGPGAADRLDALVVHHTASANRYTSSEVPAIIRGIYRYHTKSRGWSDIGYGFLIDRWGRVYEGRSGSTYEPIVGAHATSHNFRTMGIALLGDFGTATPTKASRVALARLVAWKADLHHMPAVGSVRLGDGAHSHKRVLGHRDAKGGDATGTACPGKVMYGYLDWVRRAALRLGNPKLYLPRTNTTTLRPDGDGIAEEWRITGWFSREVSWSVKISDAAGNTVHSQQGVSRRLETPAGDGVVWDGRINGLPAPTGRYTWALTATDAGGREARGDSGEFLVVRDHLGGTLLRDPDGTYWIDGGAARPVSGIALRTVFSQRTPVMTGRDERARYSIGTPVDLRDGALLVGSDAARYVRSGGLLRSIDPAVFEALAFDRRALIPASQQELSAIPPGAAWTDITRHPAGVIVAERVRNGVGAVIETRYWRLGQASRSPMSAVAVASRVRAEEVVEAIQGDLSLTVGPATGVLDGVLLGDGSRWIITSGQRRKFVESDLFFGYGYDDRMLLPTTTASLNEYPPGGPVRT